MITSVLQIFSVLIFIQQCKVSSIIVEESFCENVSLYKHIHAFIPARSYNQFLSSLGQRTKNYGYALKFIIFFLRMSGVWSILTGKQVLLSLGSNSNNGKEQQLIVRFLLMLCSLT